jgi:ribonuclease D
MHWIDTEPALREVTAQLAQAKTLFIDTEFDSSRTGTDLCLLQISDGRSVYLIDALRLPRLTALATALGEPDREWVLHAGQQDVGLIAERLEIERRPRVFDTQVAWALSSVEHSVSLAYLQYRLLGLRGGKGHQVDDWKRRPLPPAQRSYAASDVEHLPALHAELKARLERLGRDGIVFEASAESIWPARVPERSPLSLDSFRNAWQLDRESQAALCFLIDWYNELPTEARAEAPEPKTLLAIASRLPESAADLLRMKGVPRRFATAHGDRLSAGLIRAAARAGADDFVEIEPPPYATSFELRLDGWLSAARSEVCAELEVAPELVLPGRVLKQLRSLLLEGRSLASAFRELGGFREQLLSEAFQHFASRLPPPRERE